ncbi:hypothetical protein EFZ10_08305 [Tatumella sp. TA1]|uniref:hypothetical protein n=1 Tax=Rosenbergiella collisarenosi TaxID=1544695 RepID=UPI0008F90E13|nr:hypothetical protein [Rosenbergiella collisarenosi]MBT0721037.1 hypothetical protein [Rosenbergiella collisarenosi]QGX91628.1 hypothetical protein EFZ10_08305 [Tatumella sp. TA1]
MRIHVLGIVLVASILSGCQAKQATMQRSTAACISYQRMMIAPLPPYQHEQLRHACEQSLR